MLLFDIETELAMAIPIRQQNTAPPRFLRTTGRILACDVDVALNDANNRFHPRIEYRYTVGNQTYTSTQITQQNAGPEPPALNRRQVEKLVRAFSQKQPVTVHYNSANPAEAYLLKSGMRTPLKLIFGT